MLLLGNRTVHLEEWASSLERVPDEKHSSFCPQRPSQIVVSVSSTLFDNVIQDLDRSQYYLMRASQFAHLRGTYNSLLYVPSDPAESKQSSHPTGFRKALNPNLDWDAIEEEYLSQEIPLLWFDG